MKIGCLGWGSLVWDPRRLPVHMPWFMDGPILPIEFARHSQGDRITLVIVPNTSNVRSLWALMSVCDLDKARQELREREQTKVENVNCWSKDSASENEIVEVIGKWAIGLGLDAVIWTALPPKFDGENGKMHSVEDVLSFLRNLPYERKKYAEEYIRKAPLQIDTDYRRKIEAEFHWTPIANY